MSGIEKIGGRLVVTYGSRTPLDTGGTLVQTSTNELVYSTSFSFPDANKTQLYQWRYAITRAPGDRASAVRQAGVAVGALPQEWETSVVIATVPTGADFIRASIALNRTSGPTYPWLGSYLNPVIPQNVWIPAAGTYVLEMGPGISRGVSFYISGNSLIAHLDQSVGPPAGNFGQIGVMPPFVPGTSTNTNTGAENIAVGGVPALPVWWNEATFIAENANFEGEFGIDNIYQSPAYVNNRRYGGVLQLPYSDPTFYGTTYSATVRVRFGIRS